MSRFAGREPRVQAAAAPGSASFKPLRVLLTLAVCGLAWWWLLRNADLDALRAQAARPPLWAWVAAGAALLAGHGLRALRLQRDWLHVRAVAWRDCLRLVLAHNAMVILLPMRSGEAAYLWAVRREWGVGWGAAALGLLRWRLQDAAVLLVLALLLLLPLPLLQRTLLALAACALLRLLLPPLWQWLARRTASVAAEGGPWKGWAASAGLWSLKVLANGGLLAALAGLLPQAALAAALGGELAGVQPLQPPAGLGTYEAGVWLAAGLPQSSAAVLVSAALAVHAFSLAVALGAAALSQLHGSACAPHQPSR